MQAPFTTITTAKLHNNHNPQFTSSTCNHHFHPLQPWKSPSSNIISHRFSICNSIAAPPWTCKQSSNHSLHHCQSSTCASTTIQAAQFLCQFHGNCNNSDSIEPVPDSHPHLWAMGTQTSNCNCLDHHHHLGLPKHRRSLHATTVPLGPNSWHRHLHSSTYNHIIIITGTSQANLR